MKNAPRKMVEDFKVGVLGASQNLRAFAAWATVAYFVLSYAALAAFCIACMVYGDLGGLIALICTTLIYPPLLYMALDGMAGIERSHRESEDREYHRRNSR